MGLQTPEKIRTFQRKLYLKAKSEWMPHDVCLKEKPVGKPDALCYESGYVVKSI
jgi:hypothetical protein